MILRKVLLNVHMHQYGLRSLFNKKNTSSVYAVTQLEHTPVFILDISQLLTAALHSAECYYRICIIFL